MRRGIGVVAQGVRDEPRTFWLAVVISGVYGAGTAGSGWLLGETTDRVLVPAFSGDEAATGARLWLAAGALALVALITAAAVAGRRIIAGRVFANLQARYRRYLTGQYLRLPLAWHHRHPAGQLLSNASADVEASFSVFNPLPMAAGVVVMALVAAVAMLVADPVLAVVGLLALPAMALANIVYQRVMSPLVVRAQSLRGEVSAVAHESFDGAVVVKTLGREAAETERFAASADRLRAANVAVGRARGGFDPVIEALPSLASLAVLAIGAWRAGSGRTTVGDIAQVVYLLTLLAAPVRAFGWVLGELPRSAVGFGRIASVLGARARLATGARTLPEGGLDLALRGVHLAHERVVDTDLDASAGLPPRDRRGERQAAAVADGRAAAAQVPVQRTPVLRGVDLHVAAGEVLALVGPTGSGKSTLASLSVHLLDPDRGTVAVGGVDVRDLAPEELPRDVALLPQSAFLFDDTVRGNVTLGADVPEHALRAALETAQATAFVDALPQGLDTRVGERGTSLSGGQRQRLALARALVRSPRVLILDDATSAVDPAVERRILDALRRPPEPGAPRPTLLLIAYRLATIALADRVAFLEGGQVVDVGTHADLLERRPAYRHLVSAYEEATLADAPPGEASDDGPAGAPREDPARPAGERDVHAAGGSR